MERNNFIFKLTKSVDEIMISSYHYDLYKAVQEALEFLGEVIDVHIDIDIEDALSEEDYKFEFKNGGKLAVISPCIIK